MDSPMVEVQSENMIPSCMSQALESKKSPLVSHHNDIYPTRPPHTAHSLPGSIQSRRDCVLGKSSRFI